MDGIELGPLNGKQSASHFETLIAQDNKWYQRYKDEYVVMGSAVKLASHENEMEALRLAQEPAEEEGVRIDFIGLVNEDTREEAIAARQERFGNNDLSL